VNFQYQPLMKLVCFSRENTKSDDMAY